MDLKIKEALNYVWQFAAHSGWVIVMVNIHIILVYFHARIFEWQDLKPCQWHKSFIDTNIIIMYIF